MFTCTLSPGFSFLCYFLDKTFSSNGPYCELKKKMFDINLSFSEFTGGSTVLSHPTLLEEKVLLDKTPNIKGIQKVCPKQAFLRILRMKILVVCDSLVTDVAPILFFSQIFYSPFLNVCLKNFRQKPESYSAYHKMLPLCILKKSEVFTKDSHVRVLSHKS